VERVGRAEKAGIERPWPGGAGVCPLAVRSRRPRLSRSYVRRDPIVV